MRCLELTVAVAMMFSKRCRSWETLWLRRSERSLQLAELRDSQHVENQLEKLVLMGLLTMHLLGSRLGTHLRDIVELILRGLRARGDEMYGGGSCSRVLS